MQSPSPSPLLAHVSASLLDDTLVITDDHHPCKYSSNSSYLISSAVKLGDVTYYIPPKPIVAECRLPFFVPTTIIEISPSDLPITSSWLSDKIKRFEATDDVFTSEFLASIAFVSRPSLGRPFGKGELDLDGFLKEWNVTKYIISVLNWKEEDELNEGPYFLTQEGLKQAWRVYEDYLDAFQVGVVPAVEGSNSFQPLPISITSSTHLSIAVPSRLYSPAPTPEKPLSGLRIGIKDIINLSGLPTSHQSRAYLALRGSPLETTAPAIQILIDKGAVVVGKTRTTQFAAGEQASGDWVDFLPPWNPRGDGWQVPGMSSAGSASAVAGYEWIDGAVGSDTLGSMTGPAALQGLFGIRISTGALNHDGVMPITDVLDTLGFFARDITLFNRVLKAWLQTPTNDKEQRHDIFPKSILYPTDHFPLSPPEVQAPISALIAKLETFLNICKRDISFADEWEKTASFANGVGIRNYMKTVVSTLQLRGSWDNSRGFANEYRSVFNREMEVHSQVKHKWKLGAKITDEQKEEAERKTREYVQWLDKYFFGDGCDGTLLVLPVFEIGKVMYRNEYRGPPEEINYIGMGWYEGLEPVLAGLPVVMIPVGQFPYESRMTERKEWLPVGLGIVAARNCDLMLVEVLEQFLSQAGMGTVKTGRLAFDIEDTLKLGEVEVRSGALGAS